MGTLELTVHVLNISPGVTLADLNNFFSYCGTVDKIHIINYSRSSSSSSSSGGGNNKNKNNKTSALVSFRQPYAFQTALLLNEATLGDGPISILPAGVIQIPIIDSEREEGLLQSAAGSVGGGGVAELAAERLCVWLSRVYEKASNFATSQLCHSNALNPNSTKQK